MDVGLSFKWNRSIGVNWNLTPKGCLFHCNFHNEKTSTIIVCIYAHC